MANNIKEFQDKFTIVSNQIDYQLQQFDIKPTIYEKKRILIELQNLNKKLEDNV